MINRNRLQISLAVALMLYLPSCSSEEEAQKFYNAGLKAYAERNLKVATENFEKALDSDKKNISARLMLGKSYYYTQKFEESKQIYENFLKDYPGNSSAHVWIARILMYENATPEKVKEAKEHLFKAIQLDDSNPDAHYHLAKLFEYESDVVSALLEYNNALKLGGQLSRVHKDLAILYKKSGMDERAQEHLRATSVSDRVVTVQSEETYETESNQKKGKKRNSK
ncbi:tetratricopeptide repeat protein [Leptospira licerasiae]|uniref:tetratricopeptide repeat protein n=1 Tax=Leptospira licerasiae TaxID=447106 RepID=UPI001082E628|nr:tetratricopeptide repeat protein [Leptospira licerasiae]TGM87921.1 outer membrane protein assembly factor BamD [Leptospira licerasiae]